MKRIRQRWRYIGWAAIAITVFYGALVAFELIERARV